MAAKQEETLLSRCEIPIIDLAHIGKYNYPQPPRTHLKPYNTDQTKTIQIKTSIYLALIVSPLAC